MSFFLRRTSPDLTGGGLSLWCPSDEGLLMRLTINGEIREVPDGITVSGLLTELSLDGPVAVERNALVVPRGSHASETLEADDVIEIVHFVGGG